MKTFHRSLALLLLVLPLQGWAGPVNINTADAATIARELKGIGPSKAEAIVQYRQKHGPFRSADELAQVRGIGQKTIADIRADVRVDRGPASPAAATAKAAPAKPAPASPGR
jgi:competence protein ComEA